MTTISRSILAASVVALSGPLFAQTTQVIPSDTQVEQTQVKPVQAPAQAVTSVQSQTVLQPRIQPQRAVRPQARYPQQYMPAPRYAAPANNVWNTSPYNQQSFTRSPWSNSMPWGNNSMPWSNNRNGRNNFSMPWGNNGSNGFNMPWSNNRNSNNAFNMPWNNNNGQRNNYYSGGSNNANNNRYPTGNFNGPWNNGSNSFPTVKGPWNNGWGSAPWSSERWENDPMGSPSKWINFDDPKEGVAEMWEDAIKGPHRLGKMPGGWKAPSISVPNPVDVTDTFGRRWRGLPTEVSEQADNFTYNIVK